MTDNVVKCIPCGCIPGNTSEQTYKQNVQLILCSILDALTGGGGVAENVNLAKIAGAATSVGAGVTDSGTLRTTRSLDALVQGGAKVSGSAGGIPTTGVTVLSNAADLKIITFLNTTDQVLLISLDNGSHYTIPLVASNGSAALDLASDGLKCATNIKAKADSSNTTSGALYIGVGS